MWTSMKICTECMANRWCACVQDTIAQLTRELSAAQEKVLQAEQVSGQRMDELESAHAQLQVTFDFASSPCILSQLHMSN